MHKFPNKARQKCAKLENLKWMESELYGDFLDYPGSFYYTDSFLIVQTVWNVLKVFRLSVQSLDCSDSF